MFEVKIPYDLWDEDDQAVITAWLVNDKSNVTEGQLLAEIMVEKTGYEIFSPGEGIIDIHREIDQIVSKGEIIALIQI